MDRLRFHFRAHCALVAANRNMRNMLFLQLAANMHQRRQRRIFARAWIMERPLYGLYETLLGDLERYDQAAHRNFTRCAPELFHFLLNRITPRIRRIRNNYRPPSRPGSPLEPGLMLAVTLRFLASGNFYSDMQYGFRMPTSSISESVREVCQAIVDEFWDTTK